MTRRDGRSGRGLPARVLGGLALATILAACVRSPSTAVQTAAPTPVEVPAAAGRAECRSGSRSSLLFLPGESATGLFLDACSDPSREALAVYRDDAALASLPLDPGLLDPGFMPVGGTGEVVRDGADWFLVVPFTHPAAGWPDAVLALVLRYDPVAGTLAIAHRTETAASEFQLALTLRDLDGDGRLELRVGVERDGSRLVRTYALEDGRFERAWAGTPSGPIAAVAGQVCAMLADLVGPGPCDAILDAEYQVFPLADGRDLVLASGRSPSCGTGGCPLAGYLVTAEPPGVAEVLSDFGFLDADEPERPGEPPCLTIATRPPPRWRRVCLRDGAYVTVDSGEDEDPQGGSGSADEPQAP